MVCISHVSKNPSRRLLPPHSASTPGPRGPISSERDQLHKVEQKRDNYNYDLSKVVGATTATSPDKDFPRPTLLSKSACGSLPAKMWAGEENGPLVASANGLCPGPKSLCVRGADTEGRTDFTVWDGCPKLLFPLWRMHVPFRCVTNGDRPPTHQDICPTQSQLYLRWPCIRTNHWQRVR